MENKRRELKMKGSKILFLTFSHRHQDDHKCEKLEVQKPRMAATRELVQKIVGQFAQTQQIYQ